MREQKSTLSLDGWSGSIEAIQSAFSLCGSVAQGAQEGSQTEKAAGADVFMAVNASTVELVDLERYVKEVIGDRPLVAFNLELDTLRADLGTTTLFPESKHVNT